MFMLQNYMRTQVSLLLFVATFTEKRPGTQTVAEKMNTRRYSEGFAVVAVDGESTTFHFATLGRPPTRTNHSYALHGVSMSDFRSESNYDY